jgi:hypothetical protein
MTADNTELRTLPNLLICHDPTLQSRAMRNSLGIAVLAALLSAGNLFAQETEEFANWLLNTASESEQTQLLDANKTLVNTELIKALQSLSGGAVRKRDFPKAEAIWGIFTTSWATIARQSSNFRDVWKSARN